MSHEAVPTQSEHSGSYQMSELAGLLRFMQSYQINLHNWMNDLARRQEPQPDNEMDDPNCNLRKIIENSLNKVQ